MRWCRVVGTRRDQVTVVFLPGLFAGEYLWKEQIRLLSEHGFDFIYFEDAVISRREKIADIKHLTEIYKEPFSSIRHRELLIVGNSLGGLLALLIARDLLDTRGFNVRGLILSGMPGLGDDVNLNLGTKNMVSFSYVRAIANKVYYDPSKCSDETLMKLFEPVASVHAMLQATRVLRFARRCDVKGLVSRVSLPISLIWGAHDAITPLGPWLEVVSALPNWSIFEIPEAGHSPMVEQPEYFNERFLQLLLQHSNDGKVSGGACKNIAHESGNSL